MAATRQAGPDRRLLIKVCGITRQEDADVCVGLGVDLLGFIFHEASPRHILPAEAGRITTGRLLRVGVFVRQTPAEVLGVMAAARLDLAQLHGGQDIAACREIGPERVMRVFWPARYASPVGLEAELAAFAPHCRHFLFDGGSSGGGAGVAAPWALLAGIAAGRPWFLAGGLGPVNLAAAVEACRPDGVDLNSGVESALGIKDAARLAEAVRIARERRPTGR